jgi:hypothetical protein
MKKIIEVNAKLTMNMNISMNPSITMPLNMTMTIDMAMTLNMTMKKYENKENQKYKVSHSSLAFPIVPLRRTRPAGGDVANV